MAQFSYKSELVSFSCACSERNCDYYCNKFLEKMKEIYRHEEILKVKQEVEIRPQYKRGRNKQKARSKDGDFK